MVSIMQKLDRGTIRKLRAILRAHVRKDVIARLVGLHEVTVENWRRKLFGKKSRSKS